jgi:WD40 repeat protein
MDWFVTRFSWPIMRFFICLGKKCLGSLPLRPPPSKSILISTHCSSLLNNTIKIISPDKIEKMDDIPSTSKASSSSSTQPQEYEQFTLSSIIQGHNDDAKCVVEHPNGELISGGRDGFLKFWENR